MEKFEKEFLELSQLVSDANIEINNWEGYDWENVYDLCGRNKLLANTHEYVKRINDIPQNISSAWSKVAIITVIRQKKAFTSLCNILRKAEEQNIGYALFKGEVIANLYSNPFCRISSDSDIYVDEENRESMSKIIVSAGYNHLVEKSKGIKVGVFYNQSMNHTIELHTCLYEDYEGKQIDLLHKMNLPDKSKRVKVKIGDIEVWTLGHEEHLIFQIFHVIKHFMLQGVCIRYLIDITKFVNAYYDAIDWNSFWKKVEYLRYDTFSERFFYLCEKYYGLVPGVLKDRKSKMTIEDEEKLILDFIYSGNRDGSCRQSWQLIDSMRNYLEGTVSEVKETSWLDTKRRIIFPNQRELDSYYSYAKKYKWLVPFAWIHRIFHATKKHKENDNIFSATEKVKAIEEREDVAKKLGLLSSKK